MRATNLMKVALLFAIFGIPAAEAQVVSAVKQMEVPRYDLSVGYDNIRANAPPGGCDCFGLNGGSISGDVHLTDWFSVAGQFTGSHAADVSTLGQDLTLTTFTVGPRVSFTNRRFSPFAEAFVGGAHGSDSYFPSSTSSSASANSFAFSAGGGLDIRLTRRFAVRAVEVQYLGTSFPNGTNDEQHQLMVGGGLVMKFGGFRKRHRLPPGPLPAPAPPSPPASVVALTCGTNVANVTVGEMLQIFGEAKTEPEKADVTYSWSSDGGSIDGTGNAVSINTSGMAVGDYRIKGHASLASDASVGADCSTVFRVIPVEVPPAATTTYITVPDPAAKDDKLFHENVKDAYFNVNSAAIRPDTQASIDHAATFLKAHPTIHVLISGWADPRGSVQFNLALGIKRANAVRSALITAGLPADQLEVLSNGKSSQVCTTADTKCWQENRRVSFTMKQ